MAYSDKNPSFFLETSIRRNPHYILEMETESEIDIIIGLYLPLKHSGLDEAEDNQLFELEHLPSSESIVDFADSMHDLVEEEDSGDSQETPAMRDKTRDGNEAQKRKRGPGRPVVNRRSFKEKRQEANSRERKRMRALVRFREQFLQQIGLTDCLTD